MFIVFDRIRSHSRVEKKRDHFIFEWFPRISGCRSLSLLASLCSLPWTCLTSICAVQRWKRSLSRVNNSLRRPSSCQHCPLPSTHLQSLVIPLTRHPFAAGDKSWMALFCWMASYISYRLPSGRLTTTGDYWAQSVRKGVRGQVRKSERENVWSVSKCRSVTSLRV